MKFLAIPLGLALVTAAFGIQKRNIDFVVGVDGDFKAAMTAASAAVPSEAKRFVIFFPNGEYDLTNLTADRHGKTTFSTSYVSLIGEARDKAIIANKTDTESIGHTATLYFPNNTGMYMQDLTVQNKSTFCGSSACRQVTIQQAGGDKYIFKNVKLVSGQDTYYSKGSRSYWEGGEIQGTVDFICGGGDVFFEGTNLLMKRSGGYITASQKPGNWGYVFNNTTINVSNGSYDGTFYLGRSWGAAKTVFLNTTMYAQPTAEGWGADMNSAPAVFGEYNSKNGNGGNIDVSRRKTYFDGGKNASTATTLKTVWNASDAAKYTVANVMGGSDGWAPNKLTVQLAASKIVQDGAKITWDDNADALCWVVFVNGKYKANVTTNSFDLEGIAAGSKITVRAANSMGGLGDVSNEVSTVESNVKYYSINLGETIGGTLKITEGASPNATKVAEGKTITISAIPLDGWEFESWFDPLSAVQNSNEASFTVTVQDNIAIYASFTAKKTTTFQTETGTLENAIVESSNAGFEGSGYVNFGASESSVKVPVYVNAAGTYKMTMRYANGSANSRKLNIATSENSSADAQTVNFEKTADWKTFADVDVEVKLPRGASFITFSVDDGDGPNLDQITLSPIDVEDVQDSTDRKTGLARKASHISTLNVRNIRSFTANGKQINSPQEMHQVIFKK